jgi:hypothetical protein
MAQAGRAGWGIFRKPLILADKPGDRSTGIEFDQQASSFHETLFEMYFTTCYRPFPKKRVQKKGFVMIINFDCESCTLKLLEERLLTFFIFL